jgi:ATP-dependent helicase Lhr and Lhr-like helicase
LICAPTGSGKTLAAFLWSIDRLVTTAPPEDRKVRTRVLYISPLRALAFDVEKNLRAPLSGMALAAERIADGGHVAAGLHLPEVGMRTGDTPAGERQAMLRRPPDLLITTPESLYLMLTSNAADTLANVETVIVDEIHALAATKRGAHLAVSLERLEEVTVRPPQRIGLSATQRPLAEVARFLGGWSAPGTPRDVAIVDAGISKPLEVDVVIPVEDMSDLGGPAPAPAEAPYGGLAGVAGPPRRTSIWPSIYPRILEQILAHRSTIVFCNARRQAERLAAKLNELYDELVASGEVKPDGEPAGDLVKAHHGSLAREQRIVVEDELKRGNLRAIVATSSLELGIDMGAVDLVIQVESPGAVSRGLQRIGRAGHQVGEPSRGTIYPKHRGDLLEAAVVARRMISGEIEHTRFLRNPLDVLAQQVVAHVAARGEVSVADVAGMVRRTATFAELSDELLRNTLEMLAGRYPSEEFAELRPRLVWDRANDTLRARDGSKRLAVTSGGTIPDRGLFGVFLPDGKRVGELDEEMVYESRPGETFLLGASTWRIEDITFERVTVTPAPGEPGKMPFWHGDRPGRPLELGRAVGSFVRELREATPVSALAKLRGDHALDELAARNLLQYLDEQAEATGVVPDDRTVVVERFRDEIGDWRICILSPFGTPVHAPWAMAVERRLADHYDVPVESMWGDDGIVLRLPEAADELPIEAISIEPDDIEDIIVSALPQTALFSSRFRECAGRSLLLPRRRPDQRTPLWQQRQRAADLLAVAAKYPTFPVLLEASRECLQDVFDVPALKEVLGQLRSRAVRVVSVETSKPSPMAQSLLFNWIAAYMYEGDAPLAERRAAALALDRDLLADLLGAEELRELLDPGVLADVELDVQHLSDGRRARTADELHDVLRRVGDLTATEIELRCEPAGGETAEGLLATLLAERRAIEVSIADEARFVAAENAARYRDALGCALPLGLPQAFTDPVPRPLEELVARYARTRGPFVERDVATRFGLPESRVAGALAALELDGRAVRGEFRPDGVRREWCDVEILRQLRRRSLAVLRREVEPVEPVVLAEFLPAWQGVSATRRGVEALVETVGVLAGAPLVASTLEADVLAARVAGYRSSMLDELCTAGDVVWLGAGAIGSSDGRVRLCFADQIALLAPSWERVEPPTGDLHDTIRQLLGAGGASFWAQLRVGAIGPTDAELLAALWDLVWAGEVTNDSLAALRAMTTGGRVAARRQGGGSRPRGRGRPSRLGRIGPAAGAGRWSLVAPLLVPRPTDTVSAHATAMQLVERHGVVTREAVLAEGVVGGFASVYGVLKVLEDRGQVRRGYFVSGLGAAQFALPGAVDRLRSMRRPDDPVFSDVAGELTGAGASATVVLSATDPAQPYGGTLPWPESPGRPARIGAALVVLRHGVPLVWHDRRSHHLVTFAAASSEHEWASALAALVHDGRARSVEIRKVNGASVSESPDGGWVTEIAHAAGFSDGYRGLVLRRA